MHPLFPVIFASVFILGIGLLNLLFLRLLNRRWWRKRTIRLSAIILPLAGLIGVGLWAGGEYFVIDVIAAIGSILAALAFVLEMALMISLPFSGIVHGVDHLIHYRRSRKSHKSTDDVNEDRRVFLKGAATALPVFSLAIGATGVGRALGSITIPYRKISVLGLPPTMEGLRIFQISDTHLRHYVTLNDLSTLCEKGTLLKPDIVLVTGDVSDDLRLLPDALNMIAQLNPPLGIYATLGNHEYFRGITEVKRIFGESPIPLFIDQGIQINHQGQTFYLAGIDDPRRLGGVIEGFFERTIDQALRDQRQGEFTILMSHRPDALHYAAERGINFTLAGHTHGGQIGFMGRSVFEPAFPQKYLWGTYRKDNSTMYTTAGAGHWFPFRLGCPPEAPLIELTRA